MKHWLPHPLLTPVLAGVWLLLNNTVAPGQILLGLLLGWAIPRLTLPYWPETLRVRSPRRLFAFAAFLLKEIVFANLAVARLVLAGSRALRPAFVLVPLDLRNEFAISLFANAVCLTPGTVSAKLSADRLHLLVHVLDCGDESALVATLKVDFEQPLMEIFEEPHSC